MKNVAILGSTGSVGSSSLEVLRANKNEFKVKLLVANKNHESLIKQYREFRPSYIYLHDKKEAPFQYLPSFVLLEFLNIEPFYNLSIYSS